MIAVSCHTLPSSFHSFCRGRIMTTKREPSKNATEIHGSTNFRIAERATVVWLFFAFILVFLHGAKTARAADNDPVQFNRDVRPILSDACFQCHGPDEGQRHGGLRLDLAGAAFKGGDSGPSIVPGNAEASELWKRITSTDPAIQMPPPSSVKSLTQAQVGTLKKWIHEGAEYEGHWAFKKVQRPEVPVIENQNVEPNQDVHQGTNRVHPIDAFVRSRLVAMGMAWSPEASRETLIRRVTLDLIGLPPEPQDVAAFLADESADAYEKVVDRLLTSPHYGERMAQQWLDFARYADSNGFQVDSSREMWGWRDWVIDAFNRNLPFDQFTIEQIAGDMLPNATQDQIVATGFNRNTRLNGEGGRIAEEWFAETVIDRVETVGLTWMAMTFNCCRCHDHKFDPITQQEFYQLFAIFNSVEESGVLDSEGGSEGRGNSAPVRPIPNQEQQKQWNALTLAISQAQRQVEEVAKTAASRQEVWEPNFASQIASMSKPWTLVEATSVRSDGGTTFTKQADSTWLASGANPDFDTYTMEAPLAAGPFTGILLEAFPDPSLPNQSLGRYPNGNFVLSGIEATITSPSLAAPIVANFGRAAADYEQPGWPVAAVLVSQADRKGKNRTGWAVDGPTKREPRQAIFACSSPITVPENSQITITLRHDAIDRHSIGRFRLSTASAPAESLQLDGIKIPDLVRSSLAADRAKRTPEQIDALAAYFRDHGDTALLEARQEVVKVQAADREFAKQVPIVMVMKERATPREAFILNRGEYDRPGARVERGLPAVFPSLPEGASMDRLGLAKWLVSRDHPLTSRVWVNRIWEHFFGVGLVKTTENLGSQSEWPSHPELLDWLASEWMEPIYSPDGSPSKTIPWDMKALQKMIVMSATYRQSAKVTSSSDPENRLLARGPRFRLSAEAARDQALAVSGLLSPKIGGPSVRPYMPEGVWDETSRYGDLRGYKNDTDDRLYRRTLYTFWKRTAAPPSMMLFDAPSREVCTVKRSRTNTPLQALILLNEVTYVEAARKLAERMIQQGGSDLQTRIAYGFLLVTARQPTHEELQLLLAGFQEDANRFVSDPKAASQLTRFGESAADSSIDPMELAAYTMTANVLLNLDEAITRE